MRDLHKNESIRGPRIDYYLKELRTELFAEIMHPRPINRGIAIWA